MEQNRCPGCMNIKSGAVCEHCGYDEQQQNAPHQLQIGTVLQDKYLIGRTLGQGGFGVTYLGWNRYLETKVAIKEYYPAACVDRNTTHNTSVTCRTQQLEEFYAENRMRFLREAKTLAKLQNVPQIVSIHDFFEMNNTAYIVMEYLQGNDLRSYVRKQGGRLTPTETLNIMRPVMAALAQIHEAGLVHRDISPDNIMLQPDGSVKLMDFGAVRSVENPGVDKELTQATQAIVKHGFAPIEQYSAKGSIGPWTDEYALCATMYYCMTGKVPENVHDRIVEGTDFGWDEIEGLTEYQKQILRKSTAVQAKDRYASIRELMSALFAQPQQVDLAQKAAQREAAMREVERRIAAAELEKQQAVQRQQTAAAGREQINRILAVVTGIICAAVVFVVLLATVIVPGVKYNRAVAMMEAGEYKDAINAFKAMGDYKDSKDMILECRYRSAIALLDAGKYEEAVAAFEAMGDYKDSAEWITECCYREAAAYAETGDIMRGIRGFAALGNYKDAEQQMNLLRKTYQQIAGTTISAGGFQAIALYENGTATAVGYNYYGQCKVSAWNDIIAVSAGGSHTVALRADGTVVAVGSNSAGQSTIPDWRDVIAISAGGAYTMALKSNGTVVAVGLNSYGQCNVSDWRDIISIEAGLTHSVGLRESGTVVAVGSNGDGQCDVSGWRDIIAVSAGYYHTVALKADGTVVAVGSNGDGQCDVSGWRDIIAVSAGYYHTVGLKADGTVVATGNNQNRQCQVRGWKDIVAISAGDDYTLALRADGTVVAVGSNDYGQCNVSGWRDIRIPGKED